MANIIDVIQCPHGLLIKDLPETMSLNTPFIVNEQQYVLSEGNTGDLMACDIEGGDITTVPKKCHRYYVIKRIIQNDED
ncbi:hypothetical protein PAEPH01_0186 [Pancytospora epiphaga]|nr:hypothetical protein PAEPH01_0186 [Pancytospora epiphaga]